MRRKTHEQFVKDVYELTSGDYTVLGSYEKNSAKIKMKHNNCGHVYEVTPGNFLMGKRCPKCFGTPKKTTKQFKEEVSAKHGDEYLVVGKYINNETKIAIKHSECGFEYDVKPTHLLDGHGCPRCTNHLKKETGIFKDEIAKMFNGNIELVGECTGSQNKVKLRCLIDGYEWETLQSNALKGNGCHRCANRERYTTETFKSKLREITNNNITVIGEYVNSVTKILVKHSKCGHEWEAIPSSLISGCGCPKCNESHGERKISAYLDKSKINYIPQYKVSGCKNKRELPFDFYIPELNLCIEYDGELHYEVARFQDKEKMKQKLKNMQINDSIKTKYCKENNVGLLRIPYWEFDNIETILENVLP